MIEGHQDDSVEPRPAGGEEETSPSQQRGGSVEASSSPPSGEAVEQDLVALLADAEAKKDEYLELAKRTQADFENFRKRMAAEVQAAALRGKVGVAADVAPVLDDLERAIEAAGLDPEGDSEDGLAHGVLLVFRGLRETLRKHGIEQVDPRGEKFDPTQHEALSTMPVEGTEPGIVVEVMQKGYRFEEQLIRPARVVVSA
ncbi:MAG TPA: nucleotide exchange factor GrpE [Solirubrobacterales bacterium]|jgi:molecular chaperone GrpE|nr:nucleotide exchange factor GrpE [Solirubrobacterales bacterium]